MPPPRLLVVDDDPTLANALCRLFAHDGIETASAESAARAIDRARTFRPDLALVDIVLPDVSGIKLLEMLRGAPATSRLPVILMTGLRAPADLMVAAAKGLDAGPIHIKDGDINSLKLRVKNALAGSLPTACHQHLRRGKLIADPQAHTASYDGQKIRFHGWRSFELLCHLLRNSLPASRHSLHQALWSDSDNPGIVGVNIGRLRHDLLPHPNIRIEATDSGYLLTVDEARP